jgi:hypothetical protein
MYHPYPQQVVFTISAHIQLNLSESKPGITEPLMGVNTLTCTQDGVPGKNITI